MGELAGLAAALSWSVAICLYRRYGDGVTAAQLNFLKNMMAIVLLLPWLLFTLPTFQLPNEIFYSMILSGIVGIAIGDSASFKALKYLSAHTTAVGLCLGPPVAAVMAYFAWGEVLTSREGIGITLTLIGVLGAVLCSRKEKENVSQFWGWGIFWVVVSGVAQGAGAVLGRHGLQHVDIAYGTYLRVMAANVLLLPSVLRTPFVARGRQLGWLSAGAFIGTGVGLVLMSMALKMTKAGVSTALMATFPIFVIPVGRVILGEKATVGSILFTLVAAGGIVILAFFGG